MSVLEWIITGAGVAIVMTGLYIRGYSDGRNGE